VEKSIVQKRVVTYSRKEKQKLNYRFHNPNSNEDLADYFIKLFVKINMKKLEEAILKEKEKA